MFVFVFRLFRFPIGGHEAVVTEEAKRMLSRTKELCYLTSFVIRLFEDAEKVRRGRVGYGTNDLRPKLGVCVCVFLLETTDEKHP